MGFSVIRYREGDAGPVSWGLLENERVKPLPWADVELRTVVEHLDERLADMGAVAEAPTLAAADVTLFSPLTLGSQLVCQGLNYAEHQAEAGVKKNRIDAEDNLIFVKSSASLTGPMNEIRRPPGCELLDYEAELGLVIRQPITDALVIPQGGLADYVAGLVICNDVSARDQQIGAPGLQWYKGKSYRTFCPAGPVFYVLEADEIQYLDNLDVRLWVNGELRQSANTSQILHKPKDTLEYLSHFTNLFPGDCLLTGTPGGVALKMTPRTGVATVLNMTRDRRRREKFRAAQRSNANYLNDGDLVEIEIASPDGHIHLGRQKNEVVSIDN